MKCATHPGATLLESIKFRRITQTELARRMKRPIKTINEIIKGKTAITPATALDLERILGTAAEFWMNLEINFRLAILRNHNQGK